ncbi:MAG: gliding motility-associated ABC transporter ATP-binding subunit GldA [Chitinophagia bacterium]|nr:gliding motility-associated ABC transporter ATP-binding subunit GldA [Chitinophagia bacterium]
MPIQIEQLTKIYGTQRAVDNISFEIGKGEIVGFLGPNGAGKSTTMKIITTYIPATGGSVAVCGYDVVKKPMEVRKRVGYLPESNPLYYDMYVREYLKLCAGIHKLGMGWKARMDDIIMLTGLSKEAHKKIGTLSKGYKQRVGLAQAMMHNPEVLILDEPTSGLDPNQLVEIRALIKEIGKEKTVMLSTHIMQEVQALCNRVIIINNGQIVADDTLAHLEEAHRAQNSLMVTFDQKVPEALLQEYLSHAEAIEPITDERWRLKATDLKALQGELMHLAANRQLTINAMQQESLNLEEVFRNLTKERATKED